MQTLRVNGYDMAYLEVGQGPPLICVHGKLGDFRTWSAVMGPLAKDYRVISVSLRHFFPEHWDGLGDDYRMSQHVADVIAFIEQIDPKPVNLMGHSRGGHISFRVAQQRPELLRKLVLAEPGGDLDATLDPSARPAAPSAIGARIMASAAKVKAGDIEGALQTFSTGSTATAHGRGCPRQQSSNCATTCLPSSARSMRTASPSARLMRNRSKPRRCSLAAPRPRGCCPRSPARWHQRSPAPGPR
jgi:esterase